MAGHVLASGEDVYFEYVEGKMGGALELALFCTKFIRYLSMAGAFAYVTQCSLRM